ncbi:MAG: sodium:calcium antiporter [Patescibacteria group bacterium]|uniref:Sodium:calcium antiporter n=1 Tax=candidate division WWE3 bacterium TaxID=2053526 RepID=A0A955ED75_UNCKA|nr:sodium:calcium antiporter [candidate division WWE3 bacterium]
MLQTATDVQNITNGTILSFAQISLAAFVIVFATKHFIKSSKKIAHHFGLSGYTISFFLIAVGTSLPDLIVSIESGIKQTPLLAYGNVVGSNIALLTLVTALPVLLVGKVSTRAVTRSKDINILVLFTLLPLALMIDGVIGRFDSIVLVVAYVTYFFYVLKEQTELEKVLDFFTDVDLFKETVIFITALITLIYASDGIVTASLELATTLNIHVAILGVTITAIGTTLPELSYAIAAIRNGKPADVLGDVVGSVVANSTLILAGTAIITPIKVSLLDDNGLISNLVLVITLFLFVRFANSKENINTLEASVLMTVYVLFNIGAYLLIGKSLF